MSEGDAGLASEDAEPYLAHLQIFPIKALDRETLDRTVIGPTGALAHDRRWAIVDAPAGEPHDPDDASVRDDYVNGKRTDAVHRLRSTYHPDGPAVTLRVDDEAGRFDPERFDLWRGGAVDGEGDDSRDSNGNERLDEWLSSYFEQEVSLRHAAEPGMPDRRYLGGPTVISTATVREVADWFDIDPESIRRRFRANVEVGGVEPFWEDRLYAGADKVVRFRIGDAVLEGVKPCGRCVTPTRDPETGEPTPEFRERFIRRRTETAPTWTDGERFEHYYTLAATTRAPSGTRTTAGNSDATAEGTPIELGDSVEILGTVPA